LSFWTGAGSRRRISPARHGRFERLAAQQPERVASLTVLCPAVLDTRTPILNVALPHIQGSLSASLDQIAWALTSYIETGRYNARLGIEHLLATIGRDGIACRAAVVRTPIILRLCWGPGGRGGELG
jgi:hypothetical protein